MRFDLGLGGRLDTRLNVTGALWSFEQLQIDAFSGSQVPDWLAKHQTVSGFFIFYLFFIKKFEDISDFFHSLRLKPNISVNLCIFELVY